MPRALTCYALLTSALCVLLVSVTAALGTLLPKPLLIPLHASGGAGLVARATGPGDQIFLLDVRHGVLLHWAATPDIQVGADTLALSPDGEQVAFAAFDPFSSRQRGLYVLGRDGAARRLTDYGLAGYNGEAVWSPDSRRMYFTASGRSQNAQVDLYQIDLADGTVRQLTDDAALERYPTLSPDGRYLAYAANPTGDYALYALDLTTCAERCGAAIRLTTDSGRVDDRPVWSPDGRQIAFLAYQNLRVTLRSLAADCVARGDCMQQPTRPLLPGFSFPPSGLVWWPDSRRVVVLYQGMNRDFGLYAADAACDDPDGCLPAQLAILSGSFARLNARLYRDG